MKNSSFFVSFTNEIFNKTLHYRNMSKEDLCAGKIILQNDERPNGTKLLIAKSENGQLEKAIYSGNKISRIEVVDAQTNGYWLQISDSGLPVFYTGEENGNAEGPFVQFHTNGSLSTVAVMIKGKLKKNENWNSDGSLAEAKEYAEPVELVIGKPVTNIVKKTN